MDKKYTKEYFEYYALISLCYCYDVALCNMKKSECPDWINKDLSIGIEVTEALIPKDGERRSIINEYFGKGYTPEELLEKASSEHKHADKLFNVMDGFVYSESIVDFSKLRELIITVIDKKLTKLNNRYSVFDTNWLYVFAETSLLDKYDIEEICKNLNLASQIKPNAIEFCKIFINCVDKLYVVSNYKIEKVIDVSNSDLSCIKLDAFTSVNQGMLHCERKP